MFRQLARVGTRIGQTQRLQTVNNIFSIAPLQSLRRFESTAASPKVDKVVQDILQLNVLESIELVKVLKEKFGYTETAFVAAAPAAAAPAAAAADVKKEEGTSSSGDCAPPRSSEQP